MGPINDSFQFCIFFLQEFRKLIKKRVTEKKKKKRWRIPQRYRIENSDNKIRRYLIYDILLFSPSYLWRLRQGCERKSNTFPKGQRNNITLTITWFGFLPFLTFETFMLSLGVWISLPKFEPFSLEFDTQIRFSSLPNSGSFSLFLQPFLW